ncbi:MAG TPA: hypothetical protein HPQ04_08120 [Rhodospirillaceae bacterium]|nr:hypothetical protein [Rhodospirillaceae bacterium]
MEYKNLPNLASYVTALMASGRLSFTPEEAQAALGIERGAFLDAAEKLQKRRQILTPRRGFYVAVPPQFLNLEGPPPSFFIDDLMRQIAANYYVGLLKAAELHGAAHQAVMEFQVVAEKQIPAMKTGRGRIFFYFRRDFDAVTGGIEQRNTDTGTMKVSSPELTILDLLRYPQGSGGLDNIVTVVDELAPNADADKLGGLCPAFERAVVQRTGYLLNKAGFDDLAEKMRASLAEGPALQWVELDPSLARDPDLTPEVVERDKHWRVLVRRYPERDL